MKKQYDHMCNEYQMVDDVSKMFYWYDGVDKLDYQMKLNKKKEEVRDEARDGEG